MPREWKLFLEDMIRATQAAIEYSLGYSEDELRSDALRMLALTKLLKNLGEAAKHIPPDIRFIAPAIPWKRITGMRDVLVHEYFDLHEPILIDVTLHKLPELLRQLHQLKELLSDRHESSSGKDG